MQIYKQNWIPDSDSVSVPTLPIKCLDRLALEDRVSFRVIIPLLLLSTSELSDVFDFVWFLEFSDSVFSESCLSELVFCLLLLLAEDEFSELSESELLSEKNNASMSMLTSILDALYTHLMMIKIGYWL